MYLQAAAELSGVPLKEEEEEEEDEA